MRHFLAWTLLLSGCVSATPSRPIDRPVLSGPHPAIGREFSLDLLGEDGGDAVVEAAPGRVLVACVLGPDGDPREGPCPGARSRWRDRITAIAIVVGGPPPDEVVRGVGFRLFVDPDGRAEEKYQLGELPRVLVADTTGRIAAVLPAPDEDDLDRVVERLVFGTDSWRR